jgi:hypothetical protein
VYRRTLINIDIAEALLNSAAGYYIGTDANPHRVLNGDIEAIPDLTAEQLPENPDAWRASAPAELDFHLIHENPTVFSQVIPWAGFWASDSIAHQEDVSWDFGGVLDLVQSRNGFYSGTLYLFPGVKQVSMSLTDSQGRASTVHRRLKVSAGGYATVYWVATVFLLGLAGIALLRIKSRSSEVFLPRATGWPG